MNANDDNVALTVASAPEFVSRDSRAHTIFAAGIICALAANGVVDCVAQSKQLVAMITDFKH